MATLCALKFHFFLGISHMIRKHLSTQNSFKGYLKNGMRKHKVGNFEVWILGFSFVHNSQGGLKLLALSFWLLVSSFMIPHKLLGAGDSRPKSGIH